MPRWYAGGDTARRSYYDREPIPIIANYFNTVPPHGQTVRASYTPPDGFAMFIESIFVQMMRSTVAAAVSLSYINTTFAPFYGGEYTIAFVPFNSNVAIASASETITSFGYMAYGDTLRMMTFDLSTGGGIQYILTMKGTEFLY